MDLKEHRLFKHLSIPFRLVGLTIDELVVCFVGFASLIFVQNKIVAGVIALSSGAFVVFIKKYKKSSSGFSFVSFINWYFGSSIARIGSYWPPSFQRRWLV